MADRKKRIEDFFNAYEKRFQEGLAGKAPDIDGTAEAFAACFVESSPAGIICGKNDKKFRASLPKGFAFYKSVGMESMQITSREITLLDDLHAMVKIHWRSTYGKKDAREVSIEFDVFYFLQTRKDRLKIFAYITGDEEKALKEKGLLPE